MRVRITTIAKTALMMLRNNAFGEMVNKLEELLAPLVLLTGRDWMASGGDGQVKFRLGREPTPIRLAPSAVTVVLTSTASPGKGERFETTKYMGKRASPSK